MSGPQFIHLETFARETSKQSKGKTNIRGVVGEALREAGYTSHIRQVGQPTCVFGDLEDLKQIETEIYEKAKTEKDPLNRKIRADANLLLAGVASYPKPLIAQTTGDDAMAYEFWKTLTLDFLKKEFGDNLRCVLEHTDEEYPHLHFYVVDRQKVSNTMGLHPGHKAKQGLKDKKAKEEAYRQAMSDWQDKFYNSVGSDVGLTRLGPQVQRLTRPEWKAQKQQAKALAGIKSSIDDEWAQLESKLDDFQAEKQAFDKKIKQAIKEAMKSVREKYEQGITMLETALNELTKTRKRLAEQYPDKASYIQQKGLSEMQASNMLKGHEDVKQEQKSTKMGASTALKPPAPKKPWENL